MIGDGCRTNIKYLPCCHGEFDCKDKGAGCIHKKTCIILYNQFEKMRRPREDDCGDPKDTDRWK